MEGEEGSWKRESEGVGVLVQTHNRCECLIIY